MVNQILSGRESCARRGAWRDGDYVAADERGNQIILAASPEELRN